MIKSYYYDTPLVAITEIACQSCGPLEHHLQIFALVEVIQCSLNASS